MGIQNKKPPVVKDATRAFRQIYDDINEIINSVNTVVNTSDEKKGKPGDLRVKKDSSSEISTTKHSLEFRSEDGWDRAITMPRNPSNKAMVYYNINSDTFEWMDGTTVIDASIEPSSPIRAMKLFSGGAVGDHTTVINNVIPNEAGDEDAGFKGVVVAGTDVSDGKGGTDYRLRSLAISTDSDVKVDTSGNFATFTVLGSSITSGGFYLKEHAADPDAPADTAGGLLYVKSDGKLYFRSNEVPGPLDLTTGGGGSITVKEVDDDPSVSDVTTIKVSNGTLTDDGGGTVTVTTSSVSSLGDLTNVNIGTDIPTEGDYTDADMMPSIGSLYIRNTQTKPEIYWRTSDLVVAKWYGSSNYVKIDDDFIDATPIPPAATLIRLYTNSGCTIYAPSYRLLGESISLYAKAFYNDAVTLPFDDNDDPNATFSNPSSTKEMSGDNGAKTVSSVTADETTDTSTSVGWTANGVEEGGVAVQDSAGTDYMYWRNNRIAGADSGVPSDADVSDPSYESLNQSYSGGYNSFEATVTVPESGRAWFGMPNGISANYCYINGEDQLDNFFTTTRNYNNGYTTKTYKIYYTNPQAETTIHMVIA